MNFAALLGHNSGRATPALRRTPTAQHNETRNLAGFHLLIARSCSDKPSQLSLHSCQTSPQQRPATVSCVPALSAAAADRRPLTTEFFFKEIGVATGLHLVIASHGFFVLALVYRTIFNRLTHMGHSMIEATFDLGATLMQTFARAIWPQIRGAAVIGAVLALALSFDETLISLFLASDQNTLPIRLWAMMRLGISPEVNAIAAVVLAVSLVLVFFATRKMERAVGTSNE